MILNRKQKNAARNASRKFNAALGARLATLREEADLTQGELGAKIGKSEAQVSRYEQGVTAVNVETMLRLNRALGFANLELLNGIYVANLYP